MNTILIATDFTAAAHNAIVYGVQLAKGLGAKVLLLNASKPVACSADMIRLVSNQEMLEESRKMLDYEVNSVKHFEVPIEVRSVIGNATDMIASVAKEIEASWIVVGMKAKDKTMRKIFGTTVISLYTHTTTPVIVVPEHAAYVEPSTIALANDINDVADLHMLDPLQQLGQRFQSYMFIVRVIGNDNKDFIEKYRTPSRIKWHLKELHSSFEFLSDEDVAHAINQFVVTQGVDMVAMVSREKTMFEKIFTRSHIKEMIFQTHVPLIILPDDGLTTQRAEEKVYYKDRAFSELHAKGY